MKGKSNQIAILYFSRSARAELRAKKWGSQFNTPLAVDTLKKLILHSKTIALDSGLPVYHINECQQIGDTFNQRFCNAIQSVYNLGYKKVIAIGNDCAELTVEDIEQTVEMLSKQEVVIGKTQKGGIYLLGMHQSGFDSFAFSEILWQTHKVADSILSLYKDKVGVLTTKSEFNTFNELIALIKRKNISASLKELALQLIQQGTYLIAQTPTSYSIELVSGVILRGPPTRS